MSSLTALWTVKNIACMAVRSIFPACFKFLFWTIAWVPSFLGDRGFYWHWFILEQTVSMFTFELGTCGCRLFFFSIYDASNQAQLITHWWYWSLINYAWICARFREEGAYKKFKCWLKFPLVRSNTNSEDCYHAIRMQGTFDSETNIGKGIKEMQLITLLSTGLHNFQY